MRMCVFMVVVCVPVGNGTSETWGIIFIIFVITIS